MTAAPIASLGRFSPFGPRVTLSRRLRKGGAVLEVVRCLSQIPMAHLCIGCPWTRDFMVILCGRLLPKRRNRSFADFRFADSPAARVLDSLVAKSPKSFKLRHYPSFPHLHPQLIHGF